MQCDCCGSEKMVEFDPYREYQHYRCKGCGFERFVRCDSAIAAGLYENDADYIDDLNVVTSSEDLILWHHLEAIKFLQSKFQSGNTTALDIGCFNGFFVKKLLSLGYDAQGVDFNKSAIAYGQEKLGLGSRITTQSIEEMIEQGKRFDVITLFEVLEHLPDMKAFLGKATKLLKNDGVIILSTPNNQMCWRPALDYPPHHLSRFTTKSLEGCLSQLEMKTLYVAEQMSTYELVRHYVGTFFRAKDSASLRGGEFKHKKFTTILRRGMNKMRKVLGVLLTPIDKLLHLFGVRYISQIVVAQKRAITG
jgi:2-polyprenyl-3-methyl-5-hydroxy-6-metoxy-1,4-benzoquinol methylase